VKPLRVALAACICAAVVPAAASAEPVSLRVHAPDRAAAHEPFPVRVAVVANAGALDIALQPLRLQVRLAPECGPTFAGTDGPTVIDRKLAPPPVPDNRYDESFKDHARVGLGTYDVCAFLVEHGDSRQFATSVDTEVAVTERCTKATRKLDRLRGKLDRADSPARRQALRPRVHAAHRAKQRSCG
jgi:hypothetical protein